IFHLLKEKLFSTQQLEDLLNYESGLKGISGISNDLRQITQAFEKGDKQAALAIDMFVHSVAGHAAKMVASLGGLDVLVFTAGIGENSALIRERVCLKLAYLGIRIDKNNNNLGRADTIISKDDSQVDCLIVRAREDLMIAFECFEKLTNSQICF
ncbi:MAG: propionate/acetate kinase, partial [Candidatus Obscuribacterales bacterium]|nr:propionate/acetate kinase [Candidatus Obscuribacterales bacterium]